MGEGGYEFNMSKDALQKSPLEGLTCDDFAGGKDVS